jgi:hypothetical protein
MKLILAAIMLGTSLSAAAQQWKTLPKGVRILGYRNVTTSKVKSTFNQYGAESSYSNTVRIDAAMVDQMPAFAGSLKGYLPEDVYNNLMAGEYKVDVGAQFNVHGFGFGYGITDKVMFYGEIAYYNAQVQARLKRTKGNTYDAAADYLEENGSGSITDATLAANLRSMADVSERQIQSYMTNSAGYKPLGDWYGSGYGDMETGFMAKVIDEGTWGLMLYPGVILPTGREDDPDILQDVGFGDGQFDFFGEVGTGYVVNDQLSFGTTFRYTYQAPTSKELRVPTERNSSMSDEKGNFNVKYGDRLNLMVNSTLSLNDWFSVTPIYRYMYQMKSQYDSEFTNANEYLSYNSDRSEHQVQLTTTVSSIQPFLKKKFILPAQINMNLVQTVSGRNVPKVGRFELELRMLF